MGWNGFDSVRFTRPPVRHDLLWPAGLGRQGSGQDKDMELLILFIDTERNRNYPERHK